MAARRYLGYIDDLVGLATWIVDSVALPRRTNTELIAGTGVTIEATDDESGNTTGITISASSASAVVVSDVVITFSTTVINSGDSLVGTGTLTGLTFDDVIAVLPPSPWSDGTLIYSVETSYPGSTIRIIVHNPEANANLSSTTLTFKVARFVGA